MSFQNRNMQDFDPHKVAIEGHKDPWADDRDVRKHHRFEHHSAPAHPAIVVDPQEVSLRMMAETVKRSKEYEFDNILHGRKAEK